MAEALMMELAQRVGRHEAHALVYRACVDVRNGKASLLDAAGKAVADGGDGKALVEAFNPSAYIGEATEIVGSALAAWTAARTPVA